MKGYLKESRSNLILMLVCFITYTIVFMTKTTYATAIASIVSENLFTKAKAGTINGFFLLFYGGMQLVGGSIADKKSPFGIIVVALVGSVLSNIVMSVTQSFIIMLVAWSFNGFIQFGLWPAMIKIVSDYLRADYQKKAMILLSFGFAGGTVLSYLFATVLLRWFRWPSLFVSSVFLLTAVLILFVFCMVYIKDKPVEEWKKNKGEDKNKNTESTVSFPEVILRSGVLYLLIPSGIYSMLSSALKSWAPTMLMECYGASTEFANFLTGSLLVINLTGIFLVEQLYPKRCKNLLIAIAVFLILMLPPFLLMIGIGYLHIAVIIVSIALITTFTSSENQLFNVLLPSKFADCKKTGAVAGIINSFACLGGFAANIIFGVLADAYSWNITFVFCIILIVIAVLLTFIAVPSWNRFMKGEMKNVKWYT